MTGDGITDVVTADATNSSISVLVGNGDGTFKARTSYAASASNPQSVVAADFNADGVIDLVTTDRGTAAVSVFIGNGDGTFKARATYGVGILGHSVMVADLNRDGINDLVTSNGNGTLNTVGVLLGNSNGTFKAHVSYATLADPQWLEGRDFNGDGFIDFAVTDTTAGVIEIFAGNGDGTLRAGVSYSAGASPYAVTVEDLNHDGHADLAYVGKFTNFINIMLGNGDGSFKARVSYLTAPGSLYDVEAYDLNGDGCLDLVTGNHYSSGINTSVSVFFGNSDGTFKAGTSYFANFGVTQVKIADANRDGAADLFTADYYGNCLSVLLGNSQRITTIARTSLLTQSEARTALTTASDILDRISREHGNIGSSQSRLLVATKNLESLRENYAGAASRIIDADVAAESAELIKNQILQQVASAVLAQANQLPALALQLLQR